jgi:phospholipid transport system substrate-binding protein
VPAALLLAAALAAAPTPAAAPAASPAAKAAAPAPAAKGAAKAPARPPPLADPVLAVREAEARLREALDEGATQQALGALAAEYVDYQDLARRSMGRHWDKLSRADRSALVTALRSLLEATYLPRLQPGGAAARTEVTVVRRQGADAELHLVATSGAQQVPLDLRLQRGQDGRWRVYDATVAGLALLEGYQEQLPQLLELGGMKRLLAQLETERQAQLKAR